MAIQKPGQLPDTEGGQLLKRTEIVHKAVEEEKRLLQKKRILKTSIHPD